MSTSIDQDSFGRKVRQFLEGVPLAADTVAMYFCMLDAKTPLWVKAAIGSALAYFMLPVDAVPDFLPVAGMTDDLAVLAGAVKVAADHLLPAHYDQAKAWFRA